MDTDKDSRILFCVYVFTYAVSKVIHFGLHVDFVTPCRLQWKWRPFRPELSNHRWTALSAGVNSLKTHEEAL